MGADGVHSHRGPLIAALWRVNGPKAIKGTIAALGFNIFKGSPYNKAFYVDVCNALRDPGKGPQGGLDVHRGGYRELFEGSPILSKYPAFTADHHAVDFSAITCG